VIIVADNVFLVGVSALVIYHAAVQSVPPVFLWLVPILVLTPIFMRAGGAVRRSLASRAREL
jgi:hypothetical protein